LVDQAAHAPVFSKVEAPLPNAQQPTWTLSGFGDEVDPDPKVQVAVLQALGASHIEVRSAWGTNVSELDDAQVAELKAVLDGAGMKVSAVASPIGKVDISLPADHEVTRLRRIIEVAKALDTGYIRMFSFFRAADQTPEDIRDAVMERISLMAAEAEQAGVVLIHENEKEIYGDTPERVLDILETVNSPALRAAWDNANFVQVGVKPFTDAYAMLRPHLEYLQVKDAIAATGEVVPTGQGDGELMETLAALRSDGYTGFASLEPHLAAQHELGGYSGPAAFGVAARAFRTATDAIGITLG
jgi:sugar phosphate isomerase/epimerase